MSRHSQLNQHLGVTRDHNPATEIESPWCKQQYISECNFQRVVSITKNLFPTMPSTKLLINLLSFHHPPFLPFHPPLSVVSLFVVEISDLFQQGMSVLTECYIQLVVSL